MIRQSAIAVFICCILVGFYSCGSDDPSDPKSEATKSLDLRINQDSLRFLKNPDKGFYHHYYDNSLWYYGVKKDTDLFGIPNLNHLFLRFCWAYLEPTEGAFDWSLIDDIVEKWCSRGYKLSLAITCSETGEAFATPEWVRNAGAKGYFSQVDGKQVWEPVYDDPVFLEKLNAFHQQMAARYDGKPYMEDIVIASCGNWGEGHNSSTSNNAISVNAIKKNIDIYVANYKKTQLVIGDDWIVWRKSVAEYNELRNYVKTLPISYRDDSILQPWWLSQNPATGSLNKPELFDDVWEKYPTTLEMDHYSNIRGITWIGENGSDKGASDLMTAIRLSHCTFLGYHGYADLFAQENPVLIRKLANYLGYWLFIDKVILAPDNSSISIQWNNKGASKPYKPYLVYLRFTQRKGGFSFIQRLSDANVALLKPGVTTTSHVLDFPAAMPAGDYSVAIGIKKEIGQDEPVMIEMGFKTAFKEPDGFFLLGNMKY